MPIELNPFLDDLIKNVEYLPLGMSRDIELIRVLNVDCAQLNKKLVNLQDEYIMLKKSKLQALQSHLPFPPHSNDHETLLSTNIKSVYDQIQIRVSHKAHISQSMLQYINEIINATNQDTSSFENEIRQSNEYSESAIGISPNTEVALRLSLSSNVLILGRVISFDPITGKYVIEDIDDLDKKYEVADVQVIPLGLHSDSTGTAPGEVVWAVYPETTIFYPATIIKPNRKSISSLVDAKTLLLEFDDDEDENGFPQAISVPRKHVIKWNP